MSVCRLVHFIHHRWIHIRFSNETIRHFSSDRIVTREMRYCLMCHPTCVQDQPKGIGSSWYSLPYPLSLSFSHLLTVSINRPTDRPSIWEIERWYIYERFIGQDLFFFFFKISVISALRAFFIFCLPSFSFWFFIWLFLNVFKISSVPHNNFSFEKQQYKKRRRRRSNQSTDTEIQFV